MSIRLCINLSITLLATQVWSGAVRADSTEARCDIYPAGSDHTDVIDVFRQSGLGSEGLIFRLPDESVYVYWNMALLDPQRERPPYEPAADLDFDAKAWTSCRGVAEEDSRDCPSGVLRTDGGQASVVIEDPAGKLFTINFLDNGVNATRGPVEFSLDGDNWTVAVNGKDVYEINRAMKCRNRASMSGAWRRTRSSDEQRPSKSTWMDLAR